MLYHRHDVRSIGTSTRGRDHHIPDLLDNEVKDIEPLWLDDDINKIALIARHGGGVSNPGSQSHCNYTYILEHGVKDVSISNLNYSSTFGPAFSLSHSINFFICPDISNTFKGPSHG
jgi:hypothetical protein